MSAAVDAQVAADDAGHAQGDTALHLFFRDDYGHREGWDETHVGTSVAGENHCHSSPKHMLTTNNTFS